MATRIIEVIQIPDMDTSFMDEIMQGGIADSGIVSNGDVFYQYEESKQLSEADSKKELEKYGIDLNKLKQWSNL